MIVDRELRILARRDDYGNAIGILFRTGDAVADQVRFRPLVEGETIDPTIRCTTDTAQRLMDELWDCGLRPTQGQGTAGQLDAVKYHLEDMRRLVFQGEKP